MAPEIAGKVTAAAAFGKKAAYGKRAYVTFLAGDGDYVKGAVGLAKGLRKVRSLYPLVVAVLPDVPASHRRLLESQGCVVREIEPVYPPENRTRFAMAYYVINYSKLRIWEAEKRPYQRPYRLKRSKHHLTPSSPPRSTPPPPPRPTPPPPPPRPTPPPVSLIADNTVMAGPGSGRRHSDRLQQQPDDAPGTSQHSSPGPQEASEQASTSGAKQKKRGPYMGFNLMRLIGAGGSGDGKVKIHFAPGTMKPAGGKADGSLPREIGLIARTEIPLHFKSWSKVTPPTRAQLMERVKAKFTSDAPPEVFEKYCLETFKARFKEHRGELSKHFKKFASEEEARENPPPGVSIDDWVMLCTRFTAESFKALSTTNTGSRSKLRWNHLAGTKSFVAHRASLSAIPDAAGSSREIGEIELFQHTHMYPGGAWIAPEVEQSHASMLHMREQYQQTQAALEASGGESQPVSEAEICSQVVGDRYLQSLGQSRSRARSRRSSAQHDRALEDQVRALEQDLIREREERDRDRAERDWRESVIGRRTSVGFPTLRGCLVWPGEGRRFQELACRRRRDRRGDGRLVACLREGSQEETHRVVMGITICTRHHG